MLSAKVIVLEYVCPTLGAIAANQMFAAPFFSVQKAIAKGSLGDLNPLPWAFQMGNTIGWVVYSILITNYFVFFANLPGFFFSCWFNLAASKLQFKQQYTRINNQSAATSINAVTNGGEDHEAASSSTTSAETPADAKTLPNNNSTETTGTQQEQPQPRLEPIQYTSPNHDYWTMGMLIFWSAVIALICFSTQSLSDQTRQRIVGVTVNCNLVFFYGAPLSTIVKILKTWNTATLHIPTMLTNTANSVFWTAYGFAILDFFIAVPNGLGAVLGGIQIVLYLILPRKMSDETDSDNIGDHRDHNDMKESANEAAHDNHRKDEENGGAAFVSGETVEISDNALSGPFSQQQQQQQQLKSD